MEECKDIMVIDWATRIPTDAEEEYLSHLFCLGGDVDIGSTEWILSCMLATCRLSASGK